MRKALVSLITGFVVFVLIGGLCLWAYLDGFSKLTIEEKAAPALWMAYLDHQGAYYKIHETFKKVEGLMKSQNMPCETYAAIYFDDPARVEESKLRSQGGCIFEVGANITFNELKIRNLPAGPAAFTQFPFKTGLSGGVGALKAYPALKEYMTSKNLTPGDFSVEIYRTKPEKKIEYYFLLRSAP